MIEVENDYVKYWIENGILFSEYKQETAITLEKCKELIVLRHKISNGEKQYWLYDLSLVTDMPKDSRDYAEIHGQEFLHACAAIVSSHITMFLYNIFIKKNKPKTPLKAFTNKKKAMEWLNEMKINIENKIAS